ncbi:MAG: glycosyltransferase [Firmicutes bacterium]|nr:glycosyltransferase [Bacillota bacterium]
MKKKEQTLVSIIMGIYNCGNYLESSIESIINQTYNNWELIMCDDGSKDNTLKIAQKYEKQYPKKIKVIKNKQNMGLNYTLNHCLEYASGDYIARQDGDDISLPERLEKEMEFLQQHPEYSLVSSNMIFFDENGDWGESKNFGEVKKENFIKGSPICHAPCIMKREALLSVGGYSVDSKLLRVEDYHLWFKFYINGYKCYNLSESLYKMRDDSNAFKRRNFKNRINETRLKLWGFRKIKISLKDYIWAFKPIMLFLLPRKIYEMLHKNNMKKLSNNKIKIAQFVGSMNCGGTETMLMNIFEKFDKEKYEVTFIENVDFECWYDKKIKDLGGSIIKIKPFRFVNYFSYCKELTKVLKQFDVVHSHTFLHTGIVLRCAKKAGVQIRIAHSHSAMKMNFSFKLKSLIFRKMILKNATNLLACSTEAGYCLYGDIFKDKGEVISNPIDLDKMNIPTKDIDELRKQHNIDNDTLIIGHVGRFVALKNHAFMLEIAKKLKVRNIKFKMMFVGDGPLFEEVKSKISDFNLKDQIILVGLTTEVYKYMKLFDLFLLPSVYEGLPVTLVEAQAAALNSLVSDNVSREADFNLGLIKFLSIDNNLDGWVNSISSFAPSKVDSKLIKKVFEKKRYTTDSLINRYEELYNIGDDTNE